MAETSDVLPACPCPIRATFLTLAPSYTFTGSPLSEAKNLTQWKFEAQLGKRALGGERCLCGSGIPVRQRRKLIQASAGLPRQSRPKGIKQNQERRTGMPHPHRLACMLRWCGPMLLTIAMHRLTARLLLLFLLASAFAPVMQALSAEPPHACCLRRAHGPSDRGAGLHDWAKRDGNCCPPMTSSHSARVLAGEVSAFHSHSSRVSPGPNNPVHVVGFSDQNSSRAPPIFLLS